MKTFPTISNLLFIVSATMLFCMCGSDEETLEAEYDLRFEKNDMQDFFVDWNHDRQIFLKLRFDEGIPKGTDWYLECNAPWVKFPNVHSRVYANEQGIDFRVEENNSYEDRDAFIYLDCAKGMPRYGAPSSATVNIHQYGFEYYLSSGHWVTFITDRSQAKNSILQIRIDPGFYLMDIDWGDGNKDILRRQDYYSLKGTIMHEYHGTSKYQVKLRFVTENYPYYNNDEITFYISEGQSIDKLNCYGKRYEHYTITNDGEYTYGTQDRLKISYSMNNGFDVVWNSK